MLLAYYSKYFIPATNKIEFILKKWFLFIFGLLTFMVERINKRIKNWQKTELKPQTSECLTSVVQYLIM